MPYSTEGLTKQPLLGSLIKEQIPKGDKPWNWNKNLSDAVDLILPKTHEESVTAGLVNITGVGIGQAAKTAFPKGGIPAQHAEARLLQKGATKEEISWKLGEWLERRKNDSGGNVTQADVEAQVRSVEEPFEEVWGLDGDGYDRWQNVKSSKDQDKINELIAKGEDNNESINKVFENSLDDDGRRIVPASQENPGEITDHWSDGGLEYMELRVRLKDSPGERQLKIAKDNLKRIEGKVLEEQRNMIRIRERISHAKEQGKPFADIQHQLDYNVIRLQEMKKLRDFHIKDYQGQYGEIKDYGEDFFDTHFPEKNTMMNAIIQKRSSKGGRRADTIHAEEFQSGMSVKARSIAQRNKELKVSGARVTEPETLRKAPFVEGGKWHEPLINRVIKEGIEQGMDYFSFSTGEEVAKRNNLFKHVDQLRLARMESPLTRHEGVMYDLEGFRHNPMTGESEELFRGAVNSKSKKEIIDYIGKDNFEALERDMGDRMDPTSEEFVGYVDKEQKIGAQWPLELYNSKYKKYIDRVFGKYGGKLEKAWNVDEFGRNVSEVWRVKYPEKMKRAIRGTKFDYWAELPIGETLGP